MIALYGASSTSKRPGATEYSPQQVKEMTTPNRTAADDRPRLPDEKPVLPGTTIGRKVGTFFVDFVLWNLQMDRSQSLNGLVDTGSTFPQAPASLLEELGIERTEAMRFRLADGSRTELSLGNVMLELEGRFAPIRIVFGPEGSGVLLGALALESFGLAADVSNQQLVAAEVLQ